MRTIYIYIKADGILQELDLIDACQKILEHYTGKYDKPYDSLVLENQELKEEIKLLKEEIKKSKEKKVIVWRGYRA